MTPATFQDPNRAGTTGAGLKPKPVDIHVHVVGNGSSGSGCWLRPRGWRKWMVPLLLREVGLPLSAASGDLDRLYVDRLLEMVRGSSLGAVVILAQDLARNDRGEVLDSPGIFHVPNDFVLQLARDHTEFLPAVSIHPARPDALQELERCLAGGAVMMKCLPNGQNIDCNDRRFTPFWEKMAEARLPLLAHTGGETTLPVVRPGFSNPRILCLPLQCGVRVIAAHCATRSGLFDPQYFDEFEDMTRMYPNLCGDISAFNTPFRGSRVRDCLRAPLAQRMLHGSDLPVPIHGAFGLLRGLITCRTFLACSRIANPLERDYRLKIGMGFGPETFTRAWELLRLPGGIGAKKTGLDGQGVTEEPGEFSN